MKPMNLRKTIVVGIIDPSDIGVVCTNLANQATGLTLPLEPTIWTDLPAEEKPGKRKTHGKATVFLVKSWENELHSHITW